MSTCDSRDSAGRERLVMSGAAVSLCLPPSVCCDLKLLQKKNSEKKMLTQ